MPFLFKKKEVELMKQVVQLLKDGRIVVQEVPIPSLSPGNVLVRNSASLVSAGTERMAVEFGQKSLLEKARSRPDLVQLVVQKAMREGVFTAIGRALEKLDQPLQLGYSSAGTVLCVGSEVTDLGPGDRVSCAGAGYAVHAEVVSVPRNLVTPIPYSSDGEPVNFQSAAFSTLGAIALHGVRLAALQIGESIAVLGLGLVGLLAVQLAKAAGVEVFGMDPDSSRCQLAQTLGCDRTATTDSVFKALVLSQTADVGVDAVVIAAATTSNGPVQLAGEIARSRGRVVSIGAVGNNLPRGTYYAKELQYRISRSYGPGRYDPEYEEKGHDYPIDYVRWTENRNLQAFLRLVAGHKVRIDPLITHRIPVFEAQRAYDLITGTSKEQFLGVLIEYPGEVNVEPKTRLAPFVAATHPPQSGARVTVGFVGAGAFASSVLIPAVRADRDSQLTGVCAATGNTAHHVGKKFGFQYCTTSVGDLLNDAKTNTVVIATRHHLHASQVVAALNARKHVFCEKPLCMTKRELREIAYCYSVSRSDGMQLMVGFNRRFAPMAEKLKSFLATTLPLVIHYRVNAGFISRTHWTQDSAQGGGRIIGEVCHFVDFVSFLAGQTPMRVFARALPDGGRYNNDNVVVTLEFENGSLGTITYVANGDMASGKERVEVFGGGAVGVLDDFRLLELVRHGRKSKMVERWRQDKGHGAEWMAFRNAVVSGAAPIPFEDIVGSTLATIRITESLRSGIPVDVDLAGMLDAATGAKTTRTQASEVLEFNSRVKSAHDATFAETVEPATSAAASQASS
jgi:predicted dehydrogenase/threonine dehydrogenase-like Zn-dependent dehydrogenase